MSMSRFYINKGTSVERDELKQVELDNALVQFRGKKKYQLAPKGRYTLQAPTSLIHLIDSSIELRLHFDTFDSLDFHESVLLRF